LGEDMKKTLSGSFKIKNFARKQVDKKIGCEKGFTPKFESHGSISSNARPTSTI
jgi:hypothetical protein